MSTEIDALVERVKGDEDLGQIFAAIGAWARAGRAADLVSAWKALERATEPSGAERFEAAADEIEEQLALTPGQASVDGVQALLAMERTGSAREPRPKETRVRAVASRLGAGQPREVLLATLARDGARPEHEELLACWMHEAVLRGASLEGEPAAARLHAALREKRHPLGTMPLSLLPTEREAPSYMPMYGEAALGRAVERLERGPMSAPTMPPPSEHEDARPAPLADPEVERRLLQALEPWTTRSNGKLEAKLFAVTPALGPAALGKWLLRGLPLACLEGASRLFADRAAADAVFGALFAAAANGGAYSAGLGGAYGRRAAWTSMGALVGAPADAAVDAVDALADRAAFLTFSAPDGWFYDVAWDLGVVALRPDGATAAVVAATDTD